MEDNISDLYKKGELYFAQGSFDKSIECWLKVLEIIPEDNVARQNVSFCYLEKEDYASSIRQTTQGLHIDPDHVEMLRIRAESYFQINQYSNAVDDIRKALDIDINDAWGLQILIYSTIFLGDIKSVRAYNKSALEYFPDHVFFRYIEAKIEFTDKNNFLAKKLILEIMADYPNNIDVLTLLINICISQKLLGEAEKYLQERIDVFADDEVSYNQLGWIYFESKEYAKGIKVFIESLKVDNNQTEAYFGLAHIYYSINDFEKSKKFISLGININNNDIRLWELCMQIAQKLNDKASSNEAAKMIDSLKGQATDLILQLKGLKRSIQLHSDK